MTTTETIGAVAAAVILVLQWWSKSKADEREEARKVAEELRKQAEEDRKAADKATHEKLEVVEKSQAEIKEYVNGPLGHAYSELARVLVANAKKTRAPADILAAHDAVKTSEKHEADTLTADAARLAHEAELAVIVSDFNKDEPKTP